MLTKIHFLPVQEKKTQDFKIFFESLKHAFDEIT